MATPSGVEDVLDGAGAKAGRLEDVYTPNTPIVNCVTRQTGLRRVDRYSAGPIVLGLSESANPTEIATPSCRSIAVPRL